MISFGQLFLNFKVLFKVGLFGEGDGVDTLEVVVVLIAEPIGGGVLCDFETLDFVGGG